MTDADNRPDSSRRARRDSVVAAIITMAVAAVLLLTLFFGGMRFDRAALASQSVAELQSDEEMFLEPELIQDAGDHEDDINDEAAPQAQGKPEPAPEESPEKVVPGPSPKPAPPVEKHVTQTRESPVKATEPSRREEEKKQAASAVAGKFSPRNGMTEGRAEGGGAGVAGVGVTGRVAGRKFLGCPHPDCTLSNKVVVRVDLVVDADGNVIQVKGASAVSGSPGSDILTRCRNAARGARWAAKAGAAPTPGSITFTITPRF